MDRTVVQAKRPIQAQLKAYDSTLQAVLAVVGETATASIAVSTAAARLPSARSVSARPAGTVDRGTQSRLFAATLVGAGAAK